MLPLSERLLIEADSHYYIMMVDGYEQGINHNDLNVIELLQEAAALAKRYEDAPVAIMDTRDALGLCAPKEADFPALYAIQGQRVRIVLDKEGAQ